MIETELKCKLSPELLSALQGKLEHMQFVGTVQNSDIYYDTPEFDLLKQAVFVRVRNNKLLECKFNEKRIKEHGQSTERSFPLFPDPAMAEKMNTLFAYFLPDWQQAANVEAAIQANGLRELVCIDNRRDAYAGNDIHVSIDHVAGLGNFLEVETRSPEGTDTAAAITRLQAFVADLHVQHINVGYVELWLLEHNPRAYTLGHYHLS